MEPPDCEDCMVKAWKCIRCGKVALNAGGPPNDTSCEWVEIDWNTYMETLNRRGY